MGSFLSGSTPFAYPPSPNCHYFSKFRNPLLYRLSSFPTNPSLRQLSESLPLEKGELIRIYYSSFSKGGDPPCGAEDLHSFGNQSAKGIRQYKNKLFNRQNIIRQSAILKMFHTIFIFLAIFGTESVDET